MNIDRRTFLAATSATLIAPRLAAANDAAPPRANELAGALGVTTGSFSRNLAAQPEAGKLVLLDLPRIMRDELGLSVIDLMTATLPSLEPAYCEEFRAAAERAGCVITNLKMNQKDLDMASADAAARKHALDTYRTTIDAAARLGCRWVRPASTTKRPDPARLASAFRELIEHGAPKGVTLLVENNGWMRDDPDAVPAIIRAVGDGLAAQPDTGNWTDEARYEGLEKAFPHAVTCDFKAFKLGPSGEHADYDLRRCFDLGWKAGFRGPWCFEHGNANLKASLAEMVVLRDLLTSWIKAAGPSS